MCLCLLCYVASFELKYILNRIKKSAKNCQLITMVREFLIGFENVFWLPGYVYRTICRSVDGDWRCRLSVGWLNPYKRGHLSFFFNKQVIIVPIYGILTTTIVLLIPGINSVIFQHLKWMTCYEKCSKKKVKWGPTWILGNVFSLCCLQDSNLPPHVSFLVWYILVEYIFWKPYWP